MKLYKARWIRCTDLVTNGSVDFKARSDYQAIQMADKIAREIDRTNSPRTITCEGRIVQSIDTGTSDHGDDRS